MGSLFTSHCLSSRVLIVLCTGFNLAPLQEVYFVGLERDKEFVKEGFVGDVVLS